MTLIVEDGAGRADAESYISVADATAYHAARGNAAWAGIATEAVREQLLRKSAEFMLQAYRQNWQGCRASSAQGLDWPRYDVTADGFAVPAASVPLQVQRACAELALKALSGDLLADLAQGVKSKTVGPIAIVYDEASRRTKKYAAVDGMLAPYMRGSGNSISLVRA